MIASWVLYCLVVAALLGGAAAAAESALRARGRPARWVWVAAVLASVALPAVALWGPESVEPLREEPGMLAEEVVAAAGDVQDPAPQWLELPARAAPAALERALSVGWVVGSAVLGFVLLFSYLRLRRSRMGWRREVVDGVPVYVTRDVGPAAVGLLRGSIVVPEWALGLESRLRRLMLLHEREHLRAGDLWLVWAALLALVAMPWNLALWWQLRRLRLAVECDCDGRVLRRAPDPRGYGALLLEVGRRRSGLGLAAVALVTPRKSLERRMRTMLRIDTRGGVLRAGAAGAAAVLLLGLACEAPEPVSAPESGPAGRLMDDVLESGLRRDSVRGREGSAGADTCAPVIYVDGVRTRVRRTSSGGDAAGGFPRLSDMISPEEIRSITVYRGEDARRYGSDVCGVIEITSENAAGAKGAEDGLGAVPLAADMTPPALRNKEEVTRAFERYYPRLLRDTGLGGTVGVNIRLDETGTVVGSRVSQSSGYNAFDEAALKVVDAMQFTPAMRGDTPVRVVLQQQVRFSVQ